MYELISDSTSEQEVPVFLLFQMRTRVRAHLGPKMDSAAFRTVSRAIRVVESCDTPTK